MPTRQIAVLILLAALLLATVASAWQAPQPVTATAAFGTPLYVVADDIATPTPTATPGGDPPNCGGGSQC